MGAVAIDIAFVNVVQPYLAGNLTRSVERLWRRARLVPQLEIRMKSGEVQRYVGPEMRQDPRGKLARFRGIIVKRGNHQVGDLEPHAALLFQPFERVQHRL